MKRSKKHFLIFQSLLLMAVPLCPSSSYSESPRVLQSFVSDGCSVPNSLNHANWESCCVAHDYAYWKGGTKEEKRQADVKFHRCLKERNATDIEMETWFTAVYELGDSRWGSGWTPRKLSTFEALTQVEKNLIQKKVKAIERECSDLSETTNCGSSKGKVANPRANCVKTIKIPILEDYDHIEKCTHGIVRTIELSPPANTKDKLKTIASLTCYKVEKKDDTSTTEHTLIFSPECDDGYFVFEDRKGATQSPYFVLQGFGSCKDKIKPPKECIDRSNFHYEFLLPDEAPNNKGGSR